MPKLKNILLVCFFTGAAGLLAQQPAPSSPSTTVSDTLLDLSCQPFIGTISLVLNSSDYRSSKTLSVAAGSFSVTLYPGTYSATLSSTTFGTTKRETWTVPNSGTTQTLANVGSPSAGIACPAALPPSGAASGDLSGTFPAPTVVKVNGTALPTSTNIVGTNASGQIVAQPNVNGITQVASNPATCAPGTTADVYNTTNSTRYYCSGTNTWSVGQSMGGTLVVGNTLSAPNLLRAYSGLASFGDSVTVGSNAIPLSNGYAYLLSQDFTGTFVNYGVSGDQAADTSFVQVYPKTNPQANSNPAYTVMIGLIDAYNYSTNVDKEANYTNLLTGIAAWLAIPRTYKLFGQDSAVTKTGTWTNDTLQTGLGVKSNTNGNTVAFSITTAGAPIYIGYKMTDSNGGTASVTVDGLAAGTINAFGQNGAVLLTTNGVTSGVGLLRYPVAAGVHAVVITVTSATNAGNIVTFLWAGTKPVLAQSSGPQVFLGGIFKQKGDIVPANATYDGFVQSVVTQLQGDGLSVYYVPTRSYLSDSDMDSGPHPNNTGHQHLRDAFESVMRPATIGAKKFSNPASNLIDSTSLVYSCKFGSGPMTLGSICPSVGFNARAVVGGLVSPVHSAGGPYAFPNGMADFVTTASVTGQGISMVPDSGASSLWANLSTQGNWDSFWIFNPNAQLVAASQFRIGYVSGYNTAAIPTNGIYLRYDTTLGDTHWMFCVDNSASEVCANSGLAPTSGAFAKVEIQEVASGTIGFTLYNGAGVVTVPMMTICASGCTATATPPTAILNVGVVLVSGNNNAPGVYLDTWQWALTGLAR